MEAVALKIKEFKPCVVKEYKISRTPLRTVPMPARCDLARGVHSEHGINALVLPPF